MKNPAIEPDRHRNKKSFFQIPLHLIFFLLPVLSLFSQQESYTVKTVPNPRTSQGGFVTDPGNILGDEGGKINDLLVQFEKDTGNEIAVVVLPSIGESVPKDFAVELFNTWKIGKKGKDNGLLLLMVIDKRRWEFETGYGLEGILPDVLLHRIGQDEMLPHFKKKNYGEGVRAGVSKILQKINDGVEYSKTEEGAREVENSYSAAGTGSTQSSDDAGMLVFYFFAGLFTLTYLSVMIARAFKAPDLKKKIDRDEITYMLPRSRLYYFIKVFFWPILIWGLILYGFNFFSFITVYFGANVALLLERIRRNSLLVKISKDPYRKYQILNKDHGAMFFVFLFTFPAGMLPMYLYYLHKKKSLRSEPRNCPSCKTPLTLLDENADDAFLTEGKRMEEYLKSVDYDVWICSSCNHADIYPYEEVFTSYSRCSSCKNKTYHTVSSRTLVSPTCSSSGKGERHNKCEFCKKEDTETYTIPPYNCNSSSSSGRSSGGGGGSSFGGGRSGGGGSGGSF